MSSYGDIDPFAPAEGPPPKTLAAFYRWAMRGAWPILGVGAALSIVIGTLEVFMAVILGWVIDLAQEGGQESFFSDNLWALLAALAFFVILRPVLVTWGNYNASVVMGSTFMAQVISRLHRHTIGQSVTFFDNDFAGRISQKEMQGGRALTQLSVDFVQTVLFALAGVVASVVMLAGIDLASALVLLVWMVPYGLMVRHFIPRIRATSARRAAAISNVSGQVVDTITNIRTVKLFAHEGFEDGAAIDAMHLMSQRQVEAGWVSVELRAWLQVLAGILPPAMVGTALWYWTQGQATTGDVVTAGAISLRLAQMTGWVTFTMMGMAENIGVIEDAMKTLARDHALTDKPNARPLEVTEGAVHFDGVTFLYDGGAGGLRDLSLAIRGGEKVGIVGGSGAGKSTLVSLLIRLYEAEQGRILIDGQNVEDVMQSSLRHQIGMVTQDTSMFNRSARDNILYGRPDADEDALRRAVDWAEVAGFIDDLRDHQNRRGYDAYLGERGVKLSGGQRQRIAIARAILKDAPILVLDEATSALDSEVEASIQDALDRVMEGKTVIAIAHRLSTLRQMDRIVVLEAGQIVEEGSHEDLLALGGTYARYWNRQSGGFLGAEAAE